MPRSSRQQADLLQNQVKASGFVSNQIPPPTFFPRESQQPLLRPVSLSLDSLASAVANLLRRVGLGQSEGFETNTNIRSGGRALPNDGGSGGGPPVNPPGVSVSGSIAPSNSVSESTSTSTSASTSDTEPSAGTSETSVDPSDTGPPSFSTSGGPGQGDCTFQETERCIGVIQLIFGNIPPWEFLTPNNCPTVDQCAPSIGARALCGCFYDPVPCQECCDDPDRGGRNPAICEGTALTFCCYQNGLLEVHFTNCCTGGA